MIFLNGYMGDYAYNDIFIQLNIQMNATYCLLERSDCESSFCDDTKEQFYIINVMILILALDLTWRNIIVAIYLIFEIINNLNLHHINIHRIIYIHPSILKIKFIIREIEYICTYYMTVFNYPRIVDYTLIKLIPY